MTDVLAELVAMSRALGDPQRDYVILGEGNTSAHVDGDSFWVKASGTELAQATPESFVRVRSSPILWAMDGQPMSDLEVKDLLKQCIFDGGTRMPSIETFLHALCLSLPGVRFVGHTHPTVAVGLLSSIRSRELFAGAMFPDQIVVTGPAYVYVPYADPGLPLALAVRSEIQQFQARYGRSPKIVLMENHGAMALGSTPREVLNTTQMFVKTCLILATSMAAGGPRFLSAAQVERIDGRPDELTRRQGFA